ncbi:MAG TPA: hypothetical protein VLF20_05585 [Patescibacteria group bacterium]|nr:hypothetical protein [Patescibacteria group bacterium]
MFNLEYYTRYALPRTVRHGVVVDELAEQMLRFAHGASRRYDLPNALGVRGNTQDIEAIELFVAKRITEKTFTFERTTDPTQREIFDTTTFNLNQIIGAHRVDYTGNPHRLSLIQQGANAILDHMDTHPVKGLLWRRPAHRRVEAWIAGTEPRARIRAVGRPHTHRH